MRHSGLIFPVLWMLLIFPSLHCQDDYAPGYVVLNEGDTLYGMVRDRNISRERIYKKIRFKGEYNGRRRFSAYEIKAYRIDGVEFESMWFEEHAAFFRFHYINRYGMGEKIFLRVLKRGKLTCYYREYIDYDSGYLDGYELFKREGDDYFERATQGILGLKKKRLSVYFSDCPALAEKIVSGEITRPLEVVSHYNNQCF